MISFNELNPHGTTLGNMMGILHPELRFICEICLYDHKCSDFNYNKNIECPNCGHTGPHTTRCRPEDLEHIKQKLIQYQKTYIKCCDKGKYWWMAGAYPFWMTPNQPRLTIEECNELGLTGQKQGNWTFDAVGKDLMKSGHLFNWEKK